MDNEEYFSKYLSDIKADIKEKEESGDHNFNDIINKLDKVISMCTKQNIEFIRQYLEQLKNMGKVGKYMSDVGAEKLVLRENSIKENISTTPEKAHWVKKEGNVIGLKSPYWYSTGIIPSRLHISSDLAHLQFYFGLEEAQGTYKNETALNQVFLEYIDKVLAKCTTEEDIKIFKELLVEMSKLGTVGKMVYNNFCNQISLENVSSAKKRNAEREPKKKQKTNNTEFDREVDVILQQYEELLSFSQALDLDTLKTIHEKGKHLLAIARSNGHSITDAIRRLEDANKSAEHTIETLDNMRFDD